MTRARRESGEREIKLGEEKYIVKYGASSLIQLENMLDMECGEIQEKLAMASLRIIRAVIFVGTRKYHKREIKQLQHPDDMLDEVEDLNDLMTPLMEAFQGGMPGVEPGDSEADAAELEAEANASSTRKRKRNPMTPEEAEVASNKTPVE